MYTTYEFMYIDCVPRIAIIYRFGDQVPFRVMVPNNYISKRSERPFVFTDWASSNKTK